MMMEMLKDYSQLEQAGFVAHLVMLVGPDAELDAAQEQLLVVFAQEAGLSPEQTPEQRQARVEAFYEQHPIPEELLDLLDDVTQDVESEEAEAAASAAKNLGGTETSKIPVGGQRVAGTFGGGAAGLMAARNAAPLKNK